MVIAVQVVPEKIDFRSNPLESALRAALKHDMWILVGPYANRASAATQAWRINNRNTWWHHYFMAKHIGKELYVKRKPDTPSNLFDQYENPTKVEL